LQKFNALKLCVRKEKLGDESHNRPRTS
jgi:hypothetical protein